MSQKKKDTQYVLKPAALPPRGNGGKYKAIVAEFIESGEDTVLIDGPIAENLKPSTLVTSLTFARKGMPVTVRTAKDDDGKVRVYLQKKPAKT